MRTTLRMIGVTLFAGALVTAVAGAAYAQGVEGGCTATVNGADPSTLTEDDPLEVDKDDTVALVGTAPSGGRNTTETWVIVAGVRVPVSDSDGSGTEWGDTVDIPSVITDLAPGIYRVEGEASGSSGWSCEGSAYVEIDGGPFTAAMALGAGLFVVGALLARRALGKTKPGGDLKAMMAKVRPGLRDQVPNLKHDPRPGMRLTAAMAGATAVAAVLAATAVELPESLIGLAAPAAAAGAGGDRVWLRGRPVGGVFGGLLMGLGLALIIHQFGVWPLDTTQGLAFPLASAVLWAVRGGIGRAFLASTTTAAPPAEESSE
ncbi:MAG: hypothetical protein ACRDJI_01335 [Actinomycetota bacterium]